MLRCLSFLKKSCRCLKGKEWQLGSLEGSSSLDHTLNLQIAEYCLASSSLPLRRSSIQQSKDLLVLTSLQYRSSCQEYKELRTENLLDRNSLLGTFLPLM